MNHWKKAIAAVLAACAALLLWSCSRPAMEEGLAPANEEERTALSDLPERTEVLLQEADELLEVREEALIEVHVCGAVVSPGVYSLTEGSRLCAALEMAGGLLDGADEDYLNQARVLSDGEQVYVPTLEETSGGTQRAREEEQRSASSSDGKVNINEASLEELMTLSGIGKTKAGAILSYRENKGPFGSAEEIMQVEGIKEGTFNKIKEQITVGS